MVVWRKPDASCCNQHTRISQGERVTFLLLLGHLLLLVVSILADNNNIDSDNNHMSIRSRKLLSSVIRLRPEHQKFQGNLHPRYVQKLVRITQEPQPLSYPLHPPVPSLDFAYPHPQPLRPLQALPFHVERTTTGNLPVYVEYNCNHQIKRTVIRRITGDVDKFAQELGKVVSNFEVRKKVGAVEIPGVHRESVFNWLVRLGF